MKILALETSGAQSEVGLLRDGELLLRAQSGTSHSRILLAMVEDILADGGVALPELDAIAVCVGPGSFTGLRIGIAVAQGLAFAVSLPVLPVSSLAALALQASEALQSADEKTNDTGPMLDILATLDARKHQIYYGWFGCQHDEILPLGKLQLAAPKSISGPELSSAACTETSFRRDLALNANGLVRAPAYIVGTGLEYGQEMPAWVQRLPRVANCHTQPGATAIAKLGEKLMSKDGQVAATDLAPVYLREKVTD